MRYALLIAFALTGCGTGAAMNTTKAYQSAPVETVEANGRKYTVQQIDGRALIREAGNFGDGFAFVMFGIDGTADSAAYEAAFTQWAQGRCRIVDRAMIPYAGLEVRTDCD